VEITVDVTPNSFGDHVVDDKYFVKPLQERMKFGKHFKVLFKFFATDIFFSSLHHDILLISWKLFHFSRIR
jgi:hypothetical protein